ncbi:MAG: hypothetical protein HQL63_14525 [Magnetococcales bacterium]|nr:hypothetical protein [Magnetococcales bacterium]
MDELIGDAGEIPLYLDPELAHALFPDLLRVLGPAQLAMLLATTRLVGMVCPGMESLFCALSLTFAPHTTPDPPVLNYQVPGWDERFSLLSIQVHGFGCTGMVNAMLRPRPDHDL